MAIDILEHNSKVIIINLSKLTVTESRKTRGHSNSEIIVSSKASITSLKKSTPAGKFKVLIKHHII